MLLGGMADLFHVTQFAVGSGMTKKVSEQKGCSLSHSTKKKAKLRMSNQLFGLGSQTHIFVRASV